jgi:NADH dehydrogenase [ubiquinone] 1 alpha subcomplex assembly factor 7
MTPLEALIRQTIAETGPMPLSAFMALCLTDPDHGVYTSGQPIGADGDFTTAPEISQVFGELIGLWAADLWRHLGSPSPFRLVELGPGRGLLMADAWRATAKVPGFHEAARVELVEVSPALRAEQSRRVPQAQHCDGLEPGPPGVVIANEFFDALPIDQLNATGERRTICIAPDGRLGWSFPDSDVSKEVRPLPFALPEDCALLVIDYGDWTIGRDTLQALKRHTRVDALAEPGLADLTSHVDFSSLVAAFANHNPFGLVTQSAFLRALGVDLRTAQLARANPAKAADIHAASRRLTHADEMGHLFKVLALLPCDWPPPAGFA